MLLRRECKLSILEKDLADLLFDKVSLYIFELMQKKARKSLENEKKNFIEKNTVIVKLNGKTIYDSSTDGIMNDDLYNALLSYGAKQDAEKETDKNTKSQLVYNLKPNITSIIA